MPGFFSSILRSINRKDTEQLHSDMRAQRATAAILKCFNGEEQKCSVLSQAASLVDLETCFCRWSLKYSVWVRGTLASVSHINLLINISAACVKTSHTERVLKDRKLKLRLSSSIKLAGCYIEIETCSSSSKSTLKSKRSWVITDPVPILEKGKMSFLEKK